MLFAASKVQANKTSWSVWRWGGAFPWGRGPSEADRGLLHCLREQMRSLISFGGTQVPNQE